MDNGLNQFPGVETLDEQLDGLLDDVAETLSMLYVTSRERFVVMAPGCKPYIPKRGDACVRLETEHIRHHVERRYGVAVYASPDGSVFICFDVDDGDKGTVHKLLESIGRFGIHRDCVYVSFSGKKGYHVEVFFDGMVPLDKLRLFYRWVIHDAGLDPRKVEYRPSDKNAVKLPLTVHYETGNVCWFVDRDTLAPIESYEPVFEVRTWSADDFLTRLFNAKCQLADSGEPEDLPAPDEDKLMYGSDVPLQKAGTRHGAMLRTAVYLRHIGADRDTAMKELMVWYARQDKQLIRSTPAEVIRDAKSLVDWVFSPGFRLNNNPVHANAQITRDDMDWVLAQPTALRRKMLFIILAHDKANYNRISKAKLSKMTGVAMSTVKRTLSVLRLQGCIESREGRNRMLPTGQFYKHPNAYFTLRDPNPSGAPDRGQVTVSIHELDEQPDRVFCDVIDSLYKPTELMKLSECRVCPEER